MNEQSFSRRDFVKTSAAAAAAVAASPLINAAHASGSDSIRVGLIGCGGRGTGAAVNSLQGSPLTRVVALGDVFEDRLRGCKSQLAGHAAVGDRAKVADDACFVGFDCYKEVIASGVDLVILATPPHFRPIHLAEAVDKGKHVFMEKPVATDPTGIRSVFASHEVADAKGLCIVAGTQRRHERSYLEAMKQVRDGRIGEVIAARCYWNQGELWFKARQPEWSDMEWQLRNWLYFTWASGDHIVEQHVHNIDAVNWAMGTHPTSALTLGGRQVRTDPDKYGHIFDHFAVEFTYPGNRFAQSMCRQIRGCDSRVSEAIHGSEGMLTTWPGRAWIEGKKPWQFEGDDPNPYVQEHTDLVKAITEGPHVNEARQVGESTLSAIMGRMSAYTGKEVTWEKALNSKLDLAPPVYAFTDLPETPVAVPGQTPLI
jgi:predicted dehydrogenase